MYLRYYTRDKFPIDQGTTGPYTAFPGTPGLGFSSDRSLSRIHQGRKCGCPTAGRAGSPVRRRHHALMGLGDAGLPSGSQLVYSATWTSAFMGASSASVGAFLAPQLAAQGIQVDKETDIGIFTSGNGFTLNLHTTADRNSPADVKSVIDGLIYQGIKVMPVSSISSPTLAAPITTLPSGVSTSAVAQYTQNYNDALAAGDQSSAAYWASLMQQAVSPAFNLTTFLTTNWPWFVAGGAGLFLMKEFV